jgi:hypothetical protein
MTLLSRRFISAAVLSTLCLSVSALADSVRCPVCAQDFPIETKECPNDGTDLKLEGKKTVTPPVTEPTSEEQVPAEAKPAAGEETKNSEGKYTRQDQGGRRKRTSSVEDEEDASSAERSDRRRRIGPERRGPEGKEDDDKFAEEQERLAREARIAKDQRLREEYEKKRANNEKATRRQAEEAEIRRRGLAELRWRSLWTQGAPVSSIGARVWWMGEGESPGTVAGAEIDVNFLREKARVGLSTFMGVRSLSDRGDLMFLETVHAGFQYPWRYSPWIVGRAGIGALVENRFDENLTWLVRAVGVEAGVDCRLQPHLVLTPSVGFMRHAVSNAGWNSVVFKFSIGF